MDAGFEGDELATESFHCTTLVTGQNGEITLKIGAGDVVVLIPPSLLSGSGICGRWGHATPSLPLRT
jgi:hypothetical protein